MEPPETGTPAASAIVNALRSRWVLPAGLGLAVAAVVFVGHELARSDEPVYHAEALVVANRLEIAVEAFPKTAVAVFETDAVAELAVSLAGTGIDPNDLIPAIAKAEPVENTGVVEIDANHADPELAVLYANAAGEALARELNRIGPGIGSFSLQVLAEVPEQPLASSRRQTAIAAVIAGVAVALAVAALMSLRTGIVAVRATTRH